MLEDKHYWKCNGCGANHITPATCDYCGASHCPECKRTNTLMNVTEFRRSVSHSVEVASQVRKKKNKPRKTSADRMAELMRLTQ